LVLQVYRIYRLNKAGRIRGPPEIIFCADDPAAIERAKLSLREDCDIQLLQEARRVICPRPQGDAQEGEEVSGC
jgi:hypothetical protein